MRSDHPFDYDCPLNFRFDRRALTFTPFADEKRASS